jgi:hypothetical protein
MTDEKVKRTGKWANRFVAAAVVQAALAMVLTGYLLYQGLFGLPAASRIVAGGGAGMWLTVGFIGFVLFGPIGMALAAGLFRQLESHMGRIAGRFTNYGLWAALLLYNVGVVGATWLMMHAGYRGGAAAQGVQFGGLGWTGAQAGLVHSQIMVYYPPYIGAFMAVALAGAVLGLVGYALVWAHRAEEAPTTQKPVTA